MVERILLKRIVQQRVKTPPNVTFLHICDPVIWFKNQGSYTKRARSPSCGSLMEVVIISWWLRMISLRSIQFYLPRHYLQALPCSGSIISPVRFGVWIAAKIGHTGGCCRREAKVYWGRGVSMQSSRQDYSQEASSHEGYTLDMAETNQRLRLLKQWNQAVFEKVPDFDVPHILDKILVAHSSWGTPGQ